MGSSGSPMNREKLRPTSLDTTLAALAPVLIISMIGSLVFFLVVALYQGDYPARLMWVLGLFTLASVLITRIAIEQSRAQSLVYLGLLAGATLLVRMQRSRNCSHAAGVYESSFHEDSGR